MISTCPAIALYGHIRRQQHVSSIVLPQLTSDVSDKTLVLDAKRWSNQLQHPQSLYISPCRVESVTISTPLYLSLYYNDLQ